MKQIQLAIIPGVLGGILCLIGVALLLFSPSQMAKDSNIVDAQDPVCGSNTKIPDKVRQWCQWITQYAAISGVDPLVVAAIIEQESGGNPAAVSRNGAVGLMQVMPGDGNALSFQCIGGPCFSDRPSTNQLLEPEYNILYGIQILSDFQNKFGDLRETLRAYGPIDMGYAYADHVLELAESYQ